MTLRYGIHPEDLVRHRLRVTLEVSGVPLPRDPELVLPVWTPGSYLVREFSRNLRDLRVSTPSGTPLPVRKVAKNRWRIEREAGEGSFTVSYSVFGHDLTCHDVDVTPEHLYGNGAALFCAVEGTQALPVELTVASPPGWKVTCELEEVGRDPWRFRGRDYDELVDSPIDAGTGAEVSFEVAGVGHRALLCGEGGNYAPDRLREDLSRIVSATYQLFGELPLRHYTFFYHLGDASRGGLEHRNSTSIVLPRWGFRPRSAYERFLSVTCHEYFHLFNVKRIHPATLGPFDYNRENYTRLLWAMEGTTDYYAGLLLRRAGLFTPARYLARLGEQVKRHLETPGRSRQSLEEASFDTWIDHYRPFEETRNLSVNYYLKGALVSLALDLHLRHESDNARSLDDVMRRLWSEYGQRDRGIPEGAYPGEVEAATGVPVRDFFSRHVEGTEELELSRFFRYAGLRLEPRESPPGHGEEPPEPAGHLGVDLKREGDRAQVTMVLEGGPGAAAGLTPGDELVALDGDRLTYEGVKDGLSRYAPGETVLVSFFRRGRLRELPVTLGRAPPEKWTLVAVPDAAPGERQIAESWLKASWEELVHLRPGAPRKADPGPSDPGPGDHGP
jgi:predicted metalloprotease with PDZ domain